MKDPLLKELEKVNRTIGFGYGFISALILFAILLIIIFHFVYE